MEQILKTGCRRPACTSCLRPQSACICQWIRQTTHQVEVLILQHPLEVAHAKGSARLLHLSLARSQLVTGEVFAEHDLLALLTAAFEQGETCTTQANADRSRKAVLLYPDWQHDRVLGLPAPPALEPAWLKDPCRLRLVVLDGTWRKSRKMLHANPLLQQLPRLSLQGLLASRYLIRKAHRPDQLSTLEATCAALAQLENSVENFQPLLTAFDGFVAQQLVYRGK
ncbi:tRNA-uridine aminocarboxypropyltransferase [Polaromonas sp.]|uniref:tRNA-uridine aminocarboxypropyltransferase n=1 Tax=Polaromonas sp. TaxID=1869339 RepID=UPI00180376F9|nr:tRNA-uridine aminocarboxypropyltransferase [Polaromonas sp.]NML84725.1 DTW domain-containing protein [Polaromonas sp.]